MQRPSLCHLLCKARKRNRLLFPSFHKRFTCESSKIICAIVCKNCRITDTGETGDRTQKHLDDISQRASKPVSHHLNGSNHRDKSDFLVIAIKQCLSGDKRRLALLHTGILDTETKRTELEIQLCVTFPSSSIIFLPYYVLTYSFLTCD